MGATKPTKSINQQTTRIPSGEDCNNYEDDAAGLPGQRAKVAPNRCCVRCLTYPTMVSRVLEVETNCLDGNPPKYQTIGRKK